MRGHFPRIAGAVSLLVATGAAGLLIVSALGQWVPGEEMPRAPTMTAPEERITVDVRNAGGVAGMARRATSHLRDAGFDVVHTGNAEAFGQDSTVVIDRVGELERARAVAMALGVGRVVSDPNPGLYADVTVRLGPEWSPPSLPEDPEDGEGAEEG